MSENVLPERPEKPLPTDCCNSGCTPCILDVYNDLLKQWEEKCKNIGNEEIVNEDVANQCIPALLQTKYSTFRVVSIAALTSDTNLFRFQAVLSEKVGEPGGGTVYRELKRKLNFGPSQYFMLQGKETIDCDEKNITRAYTPLSDQDLSIRGCFEVIIKLYPGGKMSQYVEKLAVGDITHWRGPYGGFNYESNKFKCLVMLCAGTGIAPMYSMAKSIVNNEEDDTVIKLLYCCKDEASIVLRKEIHSLRSFWNFSVDIFLSHSCSSECKPLYGETLKTVRLDQDAIASVLSGKNVSSTMVFICGSPQFCKDIEQFVISCSMDPEHIHIF